MAGKLNRSVWEGIAQRDADWGVLTSHDRRGGAWSAELDAFYATGEEVVEHLLQYPELAGVGRGRVVDWGCGTARLSLALSRRFERVLSVDVSPTMLATAATRLAERGASNVDLVLVDGVPADGDADVAITLLVLQHIPRLSEVEEALRGIAGCLRPGGRGVIEMPSCALTRKARVQPRYRIYAALRGLRVPAAALARVGLLGMSVLVVPEARFREVLAAAGLTVLRVRQGDDENFRYSRYVVERVPG